MPYDPDELVTVDIIAARLGASANTVYAWRRQGKLPDPDQSLGPNGGIHLWRWATIECLELPPPRSRLIGRPQA